MIRASLVAQWLRVCLPIQGTRVRALVWEDPTCHGATGPVSHNCWACASGACAPQREAAIVRGLRTAMKSGPRLPQLEKALAQKQRPNTAKNKPNIFNLFNTVARAVKVWYIIKVVHSYHKMNFLKSIKSYITWIDLKNTNDSFREYKYFIGLICKTAYISSTFGKRKLLKPGGLFPTKFQG